MNLFKTIIHKPADWLAERIGGEKLRREVDNHAAAIETLVEHFAPILAADPHELVTGILHDEVIAFALKQGVPAEDVEAVAKKVLEGLKK